MKFTMFTQIDMMKCAINRDCVKSIEEFKDNIGDVYVKINLTDGASIVVLEDFATVQSRLNIIEG